MAVVLHDNGVISLNNTTRHCILHAVQVLLPQQGMHTVLPRSGSHKIDGFCGRLAEIASQGRGKKKNTIPLVISEEPLVSSLEVNQFYEGALSVNDFALLIEKRLLEEQSDLDQDAIHRECWNVYHIEKRAEISFPRWFSDECMFRLWLIFNTVLEPQPETMMAVKSVNEIMKRLVELCGYTWNPLYEYKMKDLLDYPEYLEAITKYFEKFSLDTSLTCEVIQDMRDEIVDGVLKKGYLTKKGHKRRNWKRRWFVLQRTIMRYYESREKLVPKGQLVLNGKTEVKSMPDKGRRMYCFEVTCGKTGVPFEICSDDQRSKHEWMLAIKKAIALAKILEGSAKQDDFTDSLAGFYLLKYGTPNPRLMRQDSTIRNMKFQATIARQRKRLSGKKLSKTEELNELDTSRSRGSSVDDQDEYIEVRPGGDISSDASSGEEEDGYLEMSPAPVINRSLGYENVVQSLPASMGFLEDPDNSFAKPRMKSPSLPSKVRTVERSSTVRDGFKLREHPEEEDDDDDSDESYEDVKLGGVNYSSKNLEDSDELPDGYVHLVKNQGKRKKVEGEETTNGTRKLNEYVTLPTSDALPTDEDKEVSGLTSSKKPIRNSVSLDEEDLVQGREAPSPNAYLTILHSDKDVIMRSYTDGKILSPKRTGPGNVEAGPPVPPRRKSPGPEFTPPPIGPRQFQYSMKTQSPDSGGSRDAPPTPPPRPAHTLGLRMSSSPTLPMSSGSKVSRPTKTSPGLQNSPSLTRISESTMETTPSDSTHNRLLNSSTTPPLPPKC